MRHYIILQQTMELKIKGFLFSSLLLSFQFCTLFITKWIDLRIFTIVAVNRYSRSTWKIDFNFYHFPLFQLNLLCIILSILAVLKFFICSLAQISMIKSYSQLELNLPLMCDASYWCITICLWHMFYEYGKKTFFLDLTILKGRLLWSILLAVMFRENYIR